ncbi:MAG TPA: intein-containing Rv2578c family radical SAM protein [Pilimelia sp.]|nr:intein-containing Rv2578c family radical SAM protein [Pilimelia sp.]
MRWESLSVVPDQALQREAARAATPLPLALPHAVARTFDTPGFAGMTFYEVRAKSIINRVPSVSRVPFDWTINPYRGCSHACTYCLSGETPILMATGRTRKLADLRVGDEIYGTVHADGEVRYAVTQVLDHWPTVKPAYRVTLADGTELVASGDHRFLTGRGWRHVTGAASGPDRRPALAVGDRLAGTGGFTETPKDHTDYRAGYLCGVIRAEGDGAGDLREAMRRARGYLAGFRHAARDGLVTLAELIRWPEAPSECWLRGFLAGMFDADGGRDRHLLWLSDSDEMLLRQAMDALRRFRFNALLDTQRLPSGVRTILVGGGLAEQLRFKHLCDPAVTARWDLTGIPIGRDADREVVSVEPLGLELELYDITTGTGDFIANGVVSHNCFARNTHTYLDLDAGHDFDSKVIVKVNAGALLRRELAAPKWRGEHIAMGTNVDCYQRAEGKYRLMREIIAGLRDFANPFSILTKGTLILRDLDLLQQAAQVTRVGVSFSVGFVDETLWRAVEPGTPSPRRRLDAVRALAEAGFDVGVLMAPILPGLTDGDESIDATVAAIAAAGAAKVTPLSLHLRKGAREWYSAWLARTFPQLVPRYRQLYRRGAYLPEAYQKEVAARVREAALRHGLGEGSPGEARQLPDRTQPDQIQPDRTEPSRAESSRAWLNRAPPGRAEPDAVQLTLL